MERLEHLRGCDCVRVEDTAGHALEVRLVLCISYFFNLVFEVGGVNNGYIRLVEQDRC